MKKIIMVCSLLLLLCSACDKGDDVSDEQLSVYEEFKTKLINNNGTLSYNIPFSYSMSVDKVKDETYAYTVVLDKAQVAMNDIQVMALNADDLSSSDMVPTLGIFDEEQYSFVPNQVDVDKGYPKGVALNGVSKTKDFTIFVMASWLKDDHSTIQRVFFSFEVVNGEVVSNEVKNNE